MKIAIIGAGFTGLSSAYELTKLGHKVFVFEKDNKPGGLAIGYKEKNWNWSLEKHYHHWFTNDKFVLNLAKEINFPVIIKRPKTSVLIKEKIYLFDKPSDVLKFPLLPFLDKIRMSFVLFFLKINPYWKILEKYKASEILPKFMGKKAYEMIWEPLLINKFGKFSNNVSLAWFWARIKKRTPSLAYPLGGFLSFADFLVKIIEKKGGKFYFDTEIIEISSLKSPQVKFIENNKQKLEKFDYVIVTLTSFAFLKITKNMPKLYRRKLLKLRGLGATNLLLKLKNPFLTDGTYWLNICEKNSPIMAIVDHTNFMDKKNYNNEHLVYLGNYKAFDDPYFSMTKEQMLDKFDPFLKKINPSYKKNLIDYQLFKAGFAQPMIPINYSKILPPFKTPLKGVYLANIEQVYPWDRGTNYAVELGQKVIKFIFNNEKN